MKYGIIEIGSSNTKTHIYENEEIIYESNTTIEFKKNYDREIVRTDLDKLGEVIEKAMSYTMNLHVYGCSIFRSITNNELEKINANLYDNYGLKIEVVSQADEALYTASGCYKKTDYDGNMCIFIGGGGSIELIFVKNKEVIYQKYYDFGVSDITNKFPSLKNDVPDVSFDEAYDHVEDLLGRIEAEADVLILAGGDHLYWYQNARFDLLDNEIYSAKNQMFMLTRDISDKYDREAFTKSLDEIRQNSDNPKWFDGARAMKVITNCISHKINAQYLVPTKINMEEGLKIELND